MLAEENREGGWVNPLGHNWEKYFIGLCHVSEHLGHFKAIQKKVGKKRKLFGRGVPPPPLVW